MSTPAVALGGLRPIDLLDTEIGSAQVLIMIRAVNWGCLPSRLFRLEEPSRPTAAEAFSGLGGLYASGRWHTQGCKVVYRLESVALASLGRLVHARSMRALTGLNSFEVTLPDEIVERAQNLPADCKAEPAARAAGAHRDRWLKELRSVGLLLPSAIVPVEYNCVINPAHPAFDLSGVRGPARFDFDSRIRASYEAALTYRQHKWRAVERWSWRSQLESRHALCSTPFPLGR